MYSKGRWVNGLAEWTDGDTAFLSIAFTWRLDDAWQRAKWYRALGYKVRAGGPGIFTRKHYLADVAEIGGDVPDAVARHNSMATFASRGCPVGCWFCIVPKMEGKNFTELPDFIVRPVLCDNNLSALSSEYQDHIVARYVASGVPLLDANSGFEPRAFDEEVYRRWKVINRGPWRFAYDDMADRPHVARVMMMLRDLTPKRRQRTVRGLHGPHQRGDRVGWRTLCPAGDEVERLEAGADGSPRLDGSASQSRAALGERAALEVLRVRRLRQQPQDKGCG